MALSSPLSPRILRRCVSVTLLALCCWSVRADIIFDVFVGYGLGASDTIVAEANWFPVTCEVQNNGAGFKGTVEITSMHGMRRVVKLELPTGTKKRFMVPLYAAAKSRLAVDAVLRAENGKAIIEQRGLEPHVQVDSLSKAVGIMPRKHGAVSFTEPDEKMPQYAPAIAHLSSDTFPEQPIALEGISTLYLHSSRAVDLKVTQVTALLAWLHGGGRLVLAVEQPGDVTALDWLPGILPCELGNIVTNMHHSSLQQWLTRPLEDIEGASASRRDLTNVYSRYQPDDAFEKAALPVATARLRDGEILAGTRQEPLIISAARGRGELIVLLFSPELAPFNAWNNRSAFWARMAQVPPWWLAGAKNAVPRFSNTYLDGVFGAMIDSRQVKKLPIGWLLLLLIVYLVVIGPFDQFLLKKLNRQMLTWITFPAYVVVFSALIYFIGYTLRSGETEWNELQIVDVVPHGARADLRGRTYGSAYSPLNATYSLASDEPFATFRGEVTTTGEQSENDDRVELRAQTFSARVAVPVWTSQMYVHDWWRQDQAPLDFAVAARGPLWQVTIKAVSVPRLTQARLIVADQVFTVEDPAGFAAGKSYTVGRGSGQALNLFLQGRAGILQSAVGQRQHQFGSQQGGKINEDQILDSVTAASFLEQMGEMAPQRQNQPYPGGTRFVAPRTFDLSRDVREGDAVLLAFVPGHTISAPLNRFNPHFSRKGSVLRVVTPVQQ